MLHQINLFLQQGLSVARVVHALAPKQGSGLRDFTVLSPKMLCGLSDAATGYQLIVGVALAHAIVHSRTRSLVLYGELAV